MKQRKVGAVPPGRPTGDVALGDGCGKTVGMANGPISQETATAASSHSQFLGIDVAALEYLIDSYHQVAVIIAGIVILNDIAELLAVACAAPGIGIEHDITLGRHPLEFMIEDISVCGMRSAVNIEDQWIFLRWIEIRRLLNPGFNPFSIEAVVPDLFRRSDIEL